MSEAIEFLKQCDRLGITFWPAGEGKIRVEGPANLVGPDSFRRRFRAHKPALLALLAAPSADCWGCDRFDLGDAGAAGPIAWCRAEEEDRTAFMNAATMTVCPKTKH